MIKRLVEEAKGILPTIQGWCTIEKAAKLIELIVSNKLETCVEIGVFGGSSLVPQAMAIRYNGGGLVYGIDPWENNSALEEMVHPDHRKWWSELNYNTIYNDCVKNLEKQKLSKYCKLMRAKSEDVVNEFKDESIDLLHIDGNHSEVLSYKDATLYLPKVKKNGYIMFDDIWWCEVENHVTTRKAIVYLLESCDRVDTINNDCLVLQKV